MSVKDAFHRDGPGLKTLSMERWYGPGYCGVCGHRGEDLVPQAVRYWDVDDGWKLGVLCIHCGPECAERGPRVGDYASVSLAAASKARIDVLASVDLDAAYTETMQDRDH